MKTLALLLTLVASCALGQTSPDLRVVWPSMTAPGNTPITVVYADPQPTRTGANGITYTQATFPMFFTVQARTSNAPSSCQYHVYGTTRMRTDLAVFPDDYEDLSGMVDCSVAAGRIIHLVYKPISALVITLSALVGTSSPSVVFSVIANH